MKRASLLFPALLLLSLGSQLACGPSEPVPRLSQLPREGAVALVGPTAIRKTDLDYLSNPPSHWALPAAAAPSPSSASERIEGLVRDRLFSLFLDEEHPHRALPAERAQLARALLQAELEQAAGPATPEEKQRVASNLTSTLSRPRVVRSVDAYLRVERMAPLDAPYAQAQKLLEITRDAASIDEFAELVGAEKAIGAKLIANPPLTAAGKVVPLLPSDHGVQGLSKELGSALQNCTQPGTLPQVVGDEVGFHVLYCVEVYPEFERPAEEQARLREITLRSSRAGAQMAALSEKLHQSTKVTIAPQAAVLTRSYWEQRGRN